MVNWVFMNKDWHCVRTVRSDTNKSSSGTSFKAPFLALVSGVLWAEVMTCSILA